jgi:hypothetical protein
MITLSLTCHPVAFTKLRLALRFPRAKQAGRGLLRLSAPVAAFEHLREPTEPTGPTEPAEPVPEEYIEEEKESQDFGVKAD